MAIVVDKEQKRKAIALSCATLLLDKGINSITISQIALTANVGKGTIYEYFKNKDEIVFEIIRLFIAQHQKIILDIASQEIPIKEKIFNLFFLLHRDESRDHIKIYREFLAISLQNSTDKMVEFSQECRGIFMQILQDILQEGVDRGELKEEALGLVDGWMIFGLGLVVESHTAHLNPKDEIDRALDSWFRLVKKRDR
jgi:AcrR family transcriptional regulator